jgi:hypothetical protein
MYAFSKQMKVQLFLTSKQDFSKAYMLNHVVCNDIGVFAYVDDESELGTLSYKRE